MRTRPVYLFMNGKRVKVTISRKKEAHIVLSFYKDGKTTV
jgi:hypothetical protein